MTNDQKQFVVIGAAESTDTLAEELRRDFGQKAVRRLSDRAYLISCASSSHPQRLFLAFASQTLPNAEPVTAASISAWAELLLKWLVRNLEAEPGKWRLDILGLGDKVGPRRIKLIEEAVGVLLKRHRRTLNNRRLTAAEPLSPGDILVQLCCHSLTDGYLSKYHWEAGRGDWGAVVWSNRGGELEIVDDKRPPSRAFKKLEECLQRSAMFPELGLSMQKGEVCVDLGAAPGSWTYVAARRGAEVIAIDRAPLRDDLMRLKSVKFVKADAFKFKPPNCPVDWLLCDVVAFPERSLELLERWCSERWCRKFCVTFKFKGEPAWQVINELKNLLRKKCSAAYLRKLTNNKNEICAWGKCIE